VGFTIRLDQPLGHQVKDGREIVIAMDLLQALARENGSHFVKLELCPRGRITADGKAPIPRASPTSGLDRESCQIWRVGIDDTPYTVSVSVYAVGNISSTGGRSPVWLVAMAIVAVAKSSAFGL